MLILLSPAKTMVATSAVRAPGETRPEFQKEANEMALYMSQFSPDELRKILKLNPQLAKETYMRFQNFHSPEEAPLQALLAYTGVVFKHIRPEDFSREDFLFAQKSLRMVSICYGLLRPFDLIKPYRMEYNIKLPEAGDGNLYSFWRDRQTDFLINEVKQTGGLLLNLASKDVQPAFDWKKAEQSVRIITPEFKINKNGNYTTVVIYAKMARGEMTRYIIKNKIEDPELLKNFLWEGFRYEESLSDSGNWLFLQE
ncbi:YaaA family protein [Parabacteroides sp. Marseille-P3160]|uniref:YaaA family protein n=1 Tax=Parabacteroides sp. Marseille-P3160 TaxID=1917887 RepID=UPI0009BC3798|nr:YaaA family protein [Parabacteroides sp. Marseille-P3160]